MMTTSRWSLVVPVKPVRLAKSRLRELPGQVREELVVAMAADTVAAALGCPLVASAHVVTDDPRVARAVRACGATVIADRPDAGLNPALRHGAAVAARARPDCGVVALAADLPALSPAELEAALTAAAAHARALVTDSEGTGTTMLTAAAGVALDPSYGVDSRQRHVASGAVELAPGDWPGLRRDVDTMDDLAAAERLGVGRRTRGCLVRSAVPTLDAFPEPR